MKAPQIDRIITGKRRGRLLDGRVGDSGLQRSEIAGLLWMMENDRILDASPASIAMLRNVLGTGQDEGISHPPHRERHRFTDQPEVMAQV
jgi:hypothetical protein